VAQSVGTWALVLKPWFNTRPSPCSTFFSNIVLCFLDETNNNNFEMALVFFQKEHDGTHAGQTRNLLHTGVTLCQLRNFLKAEV